MTAVIGIDPGATGAMCLLKIEEGEKPFIKFWDNKHLLVPNLFLENFLEEFTLDMESCLVTRIILENVHSLGTMSAKSNFSFGGNVAISKWAAKVVGLAYTIPVDEVSPRAWQKGISFPSLTKTEKKGLNQNQRTKLQKQRAFEYASELYPETVPQLKGKRGGILDGRVDALLIAHYGVT